MININRSSGFQNHSLNINKSTKNVWKKHIILDYIVNYTPLIVSKPYKWEELFYLP